MVGKKYENEGIAKHGAKMVMAVSAAWRSNVFASESVISILLEYPLDLIASPSAVFGNELQTIINFPIMPTIKTSNP